MCVYYSRLGQKGRSLKHTNDNQPLFQNKTAEADLGSLFQVRTPEKLVHVFDKLDLVHDTPFVHPAIKTQNDSGIETPSDTLTNLNRNNVVSLNNRTAIPLSTKRSLYSNKENLPEKTKNLSTPESQNLTQSSTSIKSCSLTIRDDVEESGNKSLNNVKNDTCYVSPETSRYSCDTSLYHSIRETTVVPDSFSSSSFSTKSSESQVDSSLLTKQLGCQPLDVKVNYSTLELSPAAKHNDFVIRARSPIRPSPVGFIQDGEFKRPINSSSSVCVKCANENYLCVRGINYSILNTLGHGGSSIVYEVIYLLSILNIIQFYFIFFLL